MREVFDFSFGIWFIRSGFKNFYQSDCMEKQEKDLQIKSKLVSSLFLFCYIFLNVLFLLSFIAKYQGSMNFLNTGVKATSKSGRSWWNCYFCLFSYFPLFTLFYWTKNFPDLSSSTHTRRHTLLSDTFCFCIFVCFVFYYYLQLFS